MKYIQYVLVEFKNESPFVAKYHSKSPIDFESVLSDLIERCDFDEEVDSFTLLEGEPIETFI